MPTTGVDHRLHPRPHVAVIGGGIAGLVAARRLRQEDVAVTVFEAGTRLGGQVRTVEFSDRWVDVGAEALHAIPPVLSLLDELGLGHQVVRANDGVTWIWQGSRLRRLPAGVGPAGPTRLRPVLTSRILSPTGLARAAIEPLLPRSPATTDQSVGTFITSRFGRQITERLVDPVLGSLHAGDVTRLSMEVTAPQLAQIAHQHRSLLLAHRARRGGAPPAFLTFAHGLATFVDRLSAGSDVTIRCDSPVTSVQPTGDGFLVVGPAGSDPVAVDAVVLAVSAPVASRLLQDALPDPARHLSQAVARSATVATVVAAYDRATAERVPALSAKGLLVASGAGRLLKAATFLGSKWPHLSHPDRFLVRLSVGRAGDSTLGDLDDAEVVARLHRDLADATGLAAPPIEAHVERWPATMAQLEVGHGRRVTEARQALDRQLLGGPRGLALAGATYDGLGIAACIRSGEAAAAAVAEACDLTGVGGATEEVAS